MAYGKKWLVSFLFIFLSILHASDKKYEPPTSKKRFATIRAYAGRIKEAFEKTKKRFFDWSKSDQEAKKEIEAAITETEKLPSSTEKLDTFFKIQETIVDMQGSYILKKYLFDILDEKILTNTFEEMKRITKLETEETDSLEALKKLKQQKIALHEKIEISKELRKELKAQETLIDKIKLNKWKILGTAAVVTTGVLIAHHKYSQKTERIRRRDQDLKEDLALNVEKISKSNLREHMQKVADIMLLYTKTGVSVEELQSKIIDSPLIKSPIVATLFDPQLQNFNTSLKKIAEEDEEDKEKRQKQFKKRSSFINSTFEKLTEAQQKLLPNPSSITSFWSYKNPIDRINSYVDRAQKAVKILNAQRILAITNQLIVSDIARQTIDKAQKKSDEEKKILDFKDQKKEVIPLINALFKNDKKGIKKEITSIILTSMPRLTKEQAQKIEILKQALQEALEWLAKNRPVHSASLKKQKNYQQVIDDLESIKIHTEQNSYEKLHTLYVKRGGITTDVVVPLKERQQARLAMDYPEKISVDDKVYVFFKATTRAYGSAIIVSKKSDIIKEGKVKKRRGKILEKHLDKDEIDILKISLRGQSGKLTFRALKERTSLIRSAQFVQTFNKLKSSIASTLAKVQTPGTKNPREGLINTIIEAEARSLKILNYAYDIILKTPQLRINFTEIFKLQKTSTLKDINDAINLEKTKLKEILEKRKKKKEEEAKKEDERQEKKRIEDPVYRARHGTPFTLKSRDYYSNRKTLSAYVYDLIKNHIPTEIKNNYMRRYTYYPTTNSYGIEIRKPTTFEKEKTLKTVTISEQDFKKCIHYEKIYELTTPWRYPENEEDLKKYPHRKLKKENRHVANWKFGFRNQKFYVSIKYYRKSPLRVELEESIQNVQVPKEKIKEIDNIFFETITSEGKMTTKRALAEGKKVLYSGWFVGVMDFIGAWPDDLP